MALTQVEIGLAARGLVRHHGRMQFGGRTSQDDPDPKERVRALADSLGVRVGGFVPQPHLEDWGVSGSGSSTTQAPGGTPTTTNASFSRTYTLWRNPADRPDPVNLADLDEDRRRALDQPIPPDLPLWIRRMRERLRYPTLWSAVNTHWFADPTGTERTAAGPSDLLLQHVHDVILNQYRDAYGLGPVGFGGAEQLVSPRAVRPATIIVDGAERDGVTIDTEALITAVGVALDDGRVLTAVIDRDALELVRLEFVSDAG